MVYFFNRSSNSLTRSSNIRTSSRNLQFSLNNGFIISLATPILKVKKSKEVIDFYTITEFNLWKETIENIKSWDIKYYKGLGTSTSEEAKCYFTNFDDKNICYAICDEDDDGTTKELSIDKIELAFDKKRSEDRKSWLKTYDKDNIIEQSQKKVYYHEFIDNTDKTLI